MRKHLIIAAFEKARTTAELEGLTNPSKNRLSKILSDYFTDDVNFSFTDRSLKEYYNEAIAIEADKDINIPQQAVINGLCQYLGYESYQAFLGNNTTPNFNSEASANTSQKPKTIPFFKKHKIVLLSVLVAIILVTYIIKINQLCWMKWNGESYEEAPYKAELFQNGTLKPCNSDRLEHFKKVKDPNCNTEFFNRDGSAKVWYVKNKNGTLDCFTSYGRHPETGKDLKPITVYMIEKYFNCTNY
uniref:hypothetical protein n=1 Tax=Gelidibacter sp. TaxID=2018083 RepID=UPI004049BCCB